MSKICRSVPIKLLYRYYPKNGGLFVSQQIFARLMHFLQTGILLAVRRHKLTGLVTGKILTLRAQADMVLLAAFAYLAVFAEFIMVRRDRQAAVADNILGVKFRAVKGILGGKILFHSFVLAYGSGIYGTFAAHYSAA